MITSLLLLVSMPFAAAANECLRIGVIEEGKAPLRVMKVGRRVFGQAKLCVEFVLVPVRRAEAMTLAGELDGEMFRSDIWIKRHEDKVVGVPTPIYIDQMVAISLMEKKLGISSFDDLRGKRVVITGGHRWAETRLGALGVSPVKANSVDQFMELLKVGRVEVGLLEASLIGDLGRLEGVVIKPVSPLPYFMVLRRCHADLIAVLDDAIQWVKSNPEN